MPSREITPTEYKGKYVFHAKRGRLEGHRGHLLAVRLIGRREILPRRHAESTWRSSSPAGLVSLVHTSLTNCCATVIASERSTTCRNRSTVPALNVPTTSLPMSN